MFVAGRLCLLVYCLLGLFPASLATYLLLTTLTDGLYAHALCRLLRVNPVDDHIEVRSELQEAKSEQEAFPN